jgi:hypothetical protein
MQESESFYARNQSDKLRLREESNCLRMFETLFLHDSLTASQEERALADLEMHNLFLESLENIPCRTDGAPTTPPSISPTHALPQPGQADEYAEASTEHEGHNGRN